MPDALVLYGNRGYTSPYVFSAFVCLKEKGLPFALELLDLEGGEHHRPPYPERSVTGRVPALRHGDFWLAESSAITEYLEDVFPPPAHPATYPADPRARARIRMVQAFVRSDLAALRAERSTATIFMGEAPAPFTPAGRAAAERLVQVAERLLPAGAPFLTGSFSVGDADLALMLHRLLRNGDPCPDRLADYARRVFERPSVRAWLAETRWEDRR